MVKQLSFLLVWVGVVLPVAAEPPMLPVTRANLYGTWDFVKGESGGAVTDPQRLDGRVAVFTPDQLVLRIRAGEFVMSYSLDEKQTPTGFQARITRSPYGVGTVVKGIIGQRGARLFLCYAHEGQVPTEFTSKADGAHRLLVMKPSKVASRLEGHWVAQGGNSDGESIDFSQAKQLLEINNDEWILKQGDLRFVMSYQVDNTQMPAQVRFIMRQSPFGGEGMKASGIVSVAHDTMHFCYRVGDQPPKRFEAKAGSESRYLRYRRQN